MSDRSNSVWTPRRIVAAFAVVFLTALIASWSSLPARAGSSAATQSSPAPIQGQHRLAMRTGTVYPLELPPATASIGRRLRPFRVGDPVAYRLRKAAIDSGAMLPELPSLATLALSTTAPTFSTSFTGLAFPDSQCGPDCEPPDTQVAAGPNNIVEVTNIVGRIFDKSGTNLDTFNLNSFFGVDPTIFSSDPRIEYDTLAKRWYISFLILDTTDIATAQNGFFELAVSTDSNPLHPFNTYAVETMGDFPDQPSLGFNDDKIVTGGNSFSCTVSSIDPTSPNCANGDQEGSEFLVWNKSELLAGDTMIDTDLTPPAADTSGFPIIPAKSRSSTSTLWMVSAFGTEPNPPGPPIVLDELNIWSVTGVPGVGLGSSATDTSTTITDFTDPPSAPQKNSSHTIDTGDQRILDAVFRDGQLWASGTDACKPSGDSTQRSCMQFFEVLTGGASPVVNQDFSFGTKNFYDYYPSVDLDSSDDLITSFSQSSSNEFPSAYVDGRLAGDSVDTLGTPVLFQAGAKAYSSNDTSGLPFRWGDYSGAGVDPSDQTAIWVAAEYATSATGTMNWGTSIAKARLIAAPSITATPTATASPTVTGTPNPSNTPTASVTPTPTVSGTPTTSTTPTATASPTATPTATATATPTATATATTTATATATDSGTPTPSNTPTPSDTPTSTVSGTPTTSATPTATDTSTATLSPTPTVTDTATQTATATATQTATPTATDTATATLSATPTATDTATPTATATATQTATATATQTATPTATPTPPFGTLSVSGNLSFGAVKVNSRPSKKLKIKNKGKGALQVTVGTLALPFTVSGNGTFNLPKGKTRNVSVHFMPTTKGATPSQILSITSDDPKHPSHNLTASGSGK